MMHGRTQSETVTKADRDATCCTYLLTIRRVCFNAKEAADFRAYFRLLVAARCEVLVVDGSPSKIFAAHARVWCGTSSLSLCRHVPVDPQYKYLNGKVNGIHTGIALAANEHVILADDDIRYTPEDIERIVDLLDADHDMVRPQNYLQPLPLWARTEAARMLINRAWLSEGDYSGTLGVRRTAMQRFGHYDGDVLFDNEEIVHHFRLHRAHIAYARNLFVRKLPPTFRKWIEQRPRQAYEDFAMQTKTLFFAFLPLALILLWSLVGWRSAVALAVMVAGGAILVASCGLGDGAARFFPSRVCLYAPLWIVERAASTYWAFYWRAARGGYPFGDKLLTKGTGHAWTAGGQVSSPTSTNTKIVEQRRDRTSPNVT